MQAAHPSTVIEVWSMDEHRIGLKPVLRRVWALKGHRPVAIVEHRSQWLYLCAFVHPPSGRSHFFLVSTVQVNVFTRLLEACAQGEGAGPPKRMLLVLDRAGWHTSKQVQVPEGMQLHFLPPYSPELQPAERLWPLTNEPLINRHFRDLAELEEVQAHRCDALAEQPDLVRSHTSFHWWPQAG